MFSNKDRGRVWIPASSLRAAHHRVGWGLKIRLGLDPQLFFRALRYPIYNAHTMLSPMPSYAVMTYLKFKSVSLDKLRQRIKANSYSELAFMRK
jgi:hypothetical protein